MNEYNVYRFRADLMDQVGSSVSQNDLLNYGSVMNIIYNGNVPVGYFLHKNRDNYFAINIDVPQNPFGFIFGSPTGNLP